MSTFPMGPVGIAVSLALAAATPWQAASAADAGTLLFDVRLRYESVDDAAFGRDADALTLRTRLGWKSGSVDGLYVLLEAEDVRAPTEHYNSTGNGNVRYPVVADPAGSEWNQALLGWASASGGTELALGRQRLLLDNQRFIGNSGWRQNEQTFDAFSVRHAIGSAGTLRYAYLDEVHRVFGNEHPNPLQAAHDLDAHLLHVGWTFPLGALSGYGYLVENEDLPAASTETFGLRFAGSHPRGGLDWLYAAELARQQGWRDAPSTGHVDYVHAEAGVRVDGHAARIGTEQLGANAARAFQTPLGTAHAFNGWADRFAGTPTDGLDDRYIKFDGPLGPLRYVAAWHVFAATRDGADYGDELDLQLGWSFRPGWNALAKLADYRSDGFGSDERTFWLSVEYRY